MRNRNFMWTAVVSVALFWGLPAMATPQQPNFVARLDFPSLFGSPLAVADINGDGYPDVIAASEELDVLFGNGSGGFHASNEGSMGLDELVSFQVLDLNGDGKLDLIVGGGMSGEFPKWGIGVRFGNGDGTFQPLVFYDIGSEQVGYIAVGDFTGDGVLDVVTVGSSGVWLFAGHRNGTFDPGVVAIALTSTAGKIVAADFNRDGKLDLAVTLPAAVGKPAEGWLTLLGNGDGTFRPPTIYAAPLQPLAMKTADLNGDGRADLIFTATGDNYTYIYLGSGDGRFAGPEMLHFPAGDDIAIGDLNGDGVPDLVAARLDIAFGKGDGTFEDPFYYILDGYSGNYYVVLANLTKNERLDIVTGSQEFASVLLNQENGKFAAGTWVPVAGAIGCGTGADFNRDGKGDLAAATTAGVTILLATGDFSEPFLTGATLSETGTQCPAVGDLNGDGVPDLLVPTTSAVVSYLGNGDGTFTRKASVSLSAGACVVFADFNRDGKLDFATCGNQLALGNGDGTFRAPSQLGPPPRSGAFTSVTTGDLNDDGWPDLVATDDGFDDLYILLNNHQGGYQTTVTQPGIFTAAYDPALVILTDLNGDGNLDALIEGFDGAAAIYFGDGQGGLNDTGQQLSSHVSLHQPMFAADINGDGITDVCLLGGITIYPYLGLGNGTFEASPVAFGAGPYAGSILAENVFGQSPLAGHPDFVVPDLYGGVLVLRNITK